MTVDAGAQIRVLIGDDHPMVADGIHSLLEICNDLFVVGTMGDGRQAMDRAGAFAPT